MNLKIALNQGTIKSLSLDQALNVAVRAGYSAFGVWTNSIESFIQDGQSPEETYKLIRDSKLKIVELVFLKEWLFVEGEVKQQSLKDIEKVCQIAKAINAECICAPAFGKEGSKKVAIQNFQDFCDIAHDYKIKIAIEFIPNFKVDSLMSAWEIVDASGKDNGGILIDTFHFFKGPSSFSDIEKIPSEKIFLVHLCDCPVLDSSLDIMDQTLNYRTYPGRGDFDLERLFSELKKINYKGYFSLEILNKDFLSQNPLDVARLAKESLLKY